MAQHGSRRGGAAWRTAIAAALAAGVAATPAYAQTVEASGIGQARVRVSEPLTQLKITRAVERARTLAVPRAFINTQVQAARYASAAGLTLGPVLAVGEPPPGPDPSPPNTVARFGGNRHCGPVTTATRETVDGERVVTRTTRYRCFAPRFVLVRMSITFAAAPAPAV